MSSSPYLFTQKQWNERSTNLVDLISDQNIISRGTITRNGELTSRFKYLADYIK